MNIQKLLSLLIAVIGVSLLIFMVAVEGEPGLIPLVLIISGIGWYLSIKNKIRSKNI